MAAVNDLDASPHAAPPHFWKLALGSVGVVYGDIGTSPLYALREALHQASRDGILGESEVIGIVSLLLWTLILIVTLKYVVLMLRADNRGEGGTLSLLALAQRAVGRRTPLLLGLGIAGAALFYGDAAITPAISVLSAVEGLKLVTPVLDPYVLPITLGILFALFWVQSRGTERVAAYFGPITLVWFMVLAALGLLHAFDRPVIFRAIDPSMAVMFFIEHGFGSLCGDGIGVPGGDRSRGALRRHGPFWPRADPAGLVRRGLSRARAELLRARQPCAGSPGGGGELVLPSRSGMGAAAAGSDGDRRDGDREPGGDHRSLFAHPAGGAARSASAVRDPAHLGVARRPDLHAPRQLAAPGCSDDAGAALRQFSGAGERLRDRRHRRDGGRFPARLHRVPPRLALAAGACSRRPGPAAAIEVSFFGANLLKFFHGGYVPVLLALALALAMATWVRGTSIVYKKAHTSSTKVPSMIAMLEKSKSVMRAPGTAVFLTSDPENAPSALLHNLKHNHVLHERNILLSVSVATTPRVPEEERLSIEYLSDDFIRLFVGYGYMEEPNVPRALGLARKLGVKFDIMATSFFLSRRSFRASRETGMPLWQDHLFITLSKSGTDAASFYRLPSNRVVELGEVFVI